MKQLAPCPDTPNCISSQASNPKQFINPIRYAGGQQACMEAILDVLKQLPRITIIAEQPDYIHAECRSLIFRFVDDLEFVYSDDIQGVHIRSASRTGHYDFGVNRRRIERVRREVG